MDGLANNSATGADKLACIITCTRSAIWLRVVVMKMMEPRCGSAGPHQLRTCAESTVSAVVGSSAMIMSRLVMGTIAIMIVGACRRSSHEILVVALVRLRCG